MTARLPRTPEGSGVVRLVGATLIDGTSAPPIADSEIEIDAGRRGAVRSI